MSVRILMVDAATTRRVARNLRLTAASYEPLTARTGAEALALLGHTLPALVIIGGAPPDMAAEVLCARITALRPGLPVMLVAAPGQDRLAVLRAGAVAVIDGAAEHAEMFARIRALLREDADNPSPLCAGLAETAAGFRHAPADAASRLHGARIVLVSGDVPAASRWRAALAARSPAEIRPCRPETALAEAAAGAVPDLYLIAGTITQPGDGLRLVSELRARRESRNAAFAVALDESLRDMLPVTLDLGAGDVLPVAWDGPVADEAVLRLMALIARKRRADERRRLAERERELAHLDPLTGLANRRLARRHLDALCRQRRACSVVTVDIDWFKQVNDRHGHSAGDAALVEVARRLQRAVGPHGVVARIGGEEFLAVLPDNSERCAASVADDMRRAVSGLPVVLTGGRALWLTVSAGVAESKHAGSVAELLERADQALLQAKRRGRDQSIVARLHRAA